MLLNKDAYRKQARDRTACNYTSGAGLQVRLQSGLQSDPGSSVQRLPRLSRFDDRNGQLVPLEQNTNEVLQPVLNRRADTARSWIFVTIFLSRHRVDFYDLAP